MTLTYKNNKSVFIIQQKDGPYVGTVRYSDNPLATKEIAKRYAKLFCAAPELLDLLKAIREEAIEEGLLAPSELGRLLLSAQTLILSIEGK